jgi:hypothetical protein
MRLQYLIYKIFQNDPIAVLLFSLLINLFRHIPVEYSTIIDILSVDGVKSMIDFILIQCLLLLDADLVELPKDCVVILHSINIS